jgi:ATP-dependent Clp protease ATP-binding subunit ClpB
MSIERLMREGQYEKAGELQYSRIPELERKLHAAEEAEQHRMLEEAVTSEHIAGIVSRWTGIPVTKMLGSERDKLLKMEQAIKKRVVGQDEAINAVAKAVRRARAGLKDPGRPLGSFMFLGPTGVGKTELTKALASFLFDDEHAMVRIDMSEYMEKHSVARLIGAPPGYVGYEEGGRLTEAVRRRPYQVILFDEIEKAHADVFNVLLQVLDDGRLTDGHGRTVDFSNTLIVMTSNLGSHVIAGLRADQDIREAEGQVMDIVRSHFRPEFLNRVDEIILFHRLSRDNMRGIVDIQVARLEKMLEEKKIRLELTEAAKKLLAEKGFDPVYGARPLKRVIQRELQDELAEKILSGEVTDGSHIKVDAGGGRIVFRSLKAAKKAS